MRVSLEEKIAQMCLIGIGSKKDIVPVKKLIQNYAIGGVILYNNIYDNYKELIQLVKELKRCNINNKYPLFIAVDQNNKMFNEICNIYSASKLGKTHNIDFIKESGAYIGRILNKTGINMNLAPTLDLQCKNNNELNEYSYSKNADLVANYGLAYVYALKKEKVVSVVKHFPGYGAINKYSLGFLPIITKYDSLKATHLYPFIKAIQSQIEIIMVGHSYIRGKTGIYPCSLSSTFIKKELRRNLKFKNIVMIDDLSKKSINLLYGKRRCITLAFQSGADILCNKYYPGIENNMIKKISYFVKTGKISEKDIKDSFKRIVCLKEKNGITDNINYKGVSVNIIDLKIKKLNQAIDNYLGDI